MCFANILAASFGIMIALLMPCPIEIDVTIDGTRSYYDVQEDTFTWEYEVTVTGCISNDVDWYLAFNHMDPYSYMVTLGQSRPMTKGGTYSGKITFPNNGLAVTTCDKLAIWAYAECPHHGTYKTDLDYAPIRIKR